MADYIPLLIFILAMIYDFLVIILGRHGRFNSYSILAKASLVAISVILIIVPYASYWLVAGDPDVWDFYRSLWWIPVAFLGIVSIVLMASSRGWGRRLGDSGEHQVRVS
jgi:hypothetical protein|uniref:Uncharacterized protein n=1 Tax=Acidipropionibacterium jensenii TaxID=1749 RepID=Q9L453_9ACTN|nr:MULTISPECIES: hypothetical protein [Acidipropionibacterium]AFK88689.1 hypothetical protein [Acidipropionibacterium jensenii]CAB88400.1 hypothetical protein [Acidipropionibacterium jensenii]